MSIGPYDSPSAAFSEGTAGDNAFELVWKKEKCTYMIDIQIK